MPLGEHRDVCACRAENSERQLFQDQRPQIGQKNLPTLRITGDGQSVERPEIEKQECKRKSNDHRLGSQTKREQQGDKQVTPYSGFSNVPAVSKKREEEK